jgi:hypothetical protein
MTAIVWDKVGERRYETGIDRGVLYPPGGDAVPWNGLTSVTESRAREVKSFYMDGIKYLDQSVPGSYSAKLQAFTYPEELDALLGNPELSRGVTIYDQRASLFHLSYRSHIGNDLEGIDHGYKIHVVYNITASPSDVAFDTIGDSISPHGFEWELSGASNQMVGVRPTNHLSFDSRYVEPTLLSQIERYLYGTDTADPYLPGLIVLLGLLGILS